MDDWLTVAEFAQFVGKSPQAVYKRFSHLPEDTTKVDKGKKLINKAAAALFSEPDNEQILKQVQQLRHENTKLLATVESLNQQVERLEQERATDRDRIVFLEASISSQNDRLREANIIILSTQKALQTALESPTLPKRLPFKERFKRWIHGESDPGPQ